MKITTPTGKIIQVSIRKTNGNISLQSEDAGGAGIKGYVFEANMRELDLLKNVPSRDIIIPEGFIASDEKGA